MQRLCRHHTMTAVQDTVQIHEYLALKFDYETALGTRDFWAEAPFGARVARIVCFRACHAEVLQKDLKIQPCTCGKCAICARAASWHCIS